jgi:hypothetical protein
VRFTRSIGGGDETTTVQLTGVPAATGATIAFHEERLAGPEERAESIREWKAALDTIAAAFGAPGSIATTFTTTASTTTGSTTTGSTMTGSTTTKGADT